MQQMNLLSEVRTSTQILVGNFGENTLEASLLLVKKLREQQINTEFYPDAAKLKKQFAYCDKKQIPFVAILGEDEIKQNKITLKNMKLGQQKSLNFEEIVTEIKNFLS
jgi:histidyl-tRNA synthetase